LSIRVLIADDQELVRTGFGMILRAQKDLTVVGEASDGRETVEAVKLVKPDVVLMDIRMPHMDGLEATRRIVESGAAARVLILTTFDRDEYVYGALQAGASGFLLKDVPAEQLAQAVRIVAAGEMLLAPAITRTLVESYVTGSRRRALPPGFEELSPREREVLDLLARGRSNSEIAAALYVGDATVKTHVARVLSKLDLRDRVHAVVFAYETGLVQPGAGA
jgi:DNA-binding NarL/FixJ family response regulator